MPKNGILLLRAHSIASILPWIPRSPNPPGTRTASTISNAFSSSSLFSESIHLTFTFALLAIPPCESASLSDL
jgi:hypothetical protein